MDILITSDIVNKALKKQNDELQNAKNYQLCLNTNTCPKCGNDLSVTRIPYSLIKNKFFNALFGQNTITKTTKCSSCNFILIDEYVDSNIDGVEYW